MPVFLAASDESSGANVFGLYHYAGWVAPEQDWYRFFIPAWQERVLNGPPKIPYLHMTSIRSKAFRQQYGISDGDMEARLDEAAIVIDHLGSLYPLKITIDGGTFRSTYKNVKVRSESGGTKKYQPDFLAFNAYAFAVLLHLHHRYPEAEKIDFLVESNSDITKYVHQHYRKLPGAFKYIDRPELVPLIGRFISGGKDHVPLQAADYLCWHSQRAESNTLDHRDERRWNTIASRKGFNYQVPTETLTAIAEAYEKAEKR